MKAAADTFDATNFTADKMKDIITVEEQTEERAKIEESVKKLKMREEVKEASKDHSAVRKMVQDSVKKKAKEDKDAEDAMAKRNLVTIARYMEAFPSLLNGHIPKMAARPSFPETMEVLGSIREILASQRSMLQLANYTNVGFTLLETLWGDGSHLTFIDPRFRLNLTNVGTMFRSGMFPEMESLLMEIDIEYPWIGRQGLSMRLMSAMMGIIMKTHVMNTAPQARKMNDISQAQPVQLKTEDISDL